GDGEANVVNFRPCDAQPDGLVRLAVCKFRTCDTRNDDHGVAILRERDGARRRYKQQKHRKPCTLIVKESHQLNETLRVYRKFLVLRRHSLPKPLLKIFRKTLDRRLYRPRGRIRKRAVRTAFHVVAKIE